MPEAPRRLAAEPSGCWWQTDRGTSSAGQKASRVYDTAELPKAPALQFPHFRTSRARILFLRAELILRGPASLSACLSSRVICRHPAEDRGICRRRQSPPARGELGSGTSRSVSKAFCSSSSTAWSADGASLVEVTWPPLLCSSSPHDVQLVSPLHELDLLLRFPFPGSMWQSDLGLSWGCRSLRRLLSPSWTPWLLGTKGHVEGGPAVLAEADTGTSPARAVEPSPPGLAPTANPQC